MPIGFILLTVPTEHDARFLFDSQLISLCVSVISAIPNSEPVYAISADQDSSNRLDLNERSRVSASKNFEFGIAGVISAILKISEV